MDATVWTQPCEQCEQKSLDGIDAAMYTVWAERGSLYMDEFRQYGRSRVDSADNEAVLMSQI